MVYLLKMVIFHGYVKLPDGKMVTSDPAAQHPGPEAGTQRAHQRGHRWINLSWRHRAMHGLVETMCFSGWNHGLSIGFPCFFSWNIFFSMGFPCFSSWNMGVPWFFPWNTLISIEISKFPMLFFMSFPWHQSIDTCGNGTARNYRHGLGRKSVESHDLSGPQIFINFLNVGDGSPLF